MSSEIATESKTKSLDESLIDLVRVNPLLFEKGKRMKPYESMKERSDLWKSIATSLGLEPLNLSDVTLANYCIARWKQLRDRYRREVMKRQAQDKQTKQPLSADDWPLIEKMRFLDRYIAQHQHHHHSHKIPEGSHTVSVAVPTPSTAIAPSIFAGINYDEPLQEAMDDQPLISSEITKKNSVLPTSTQAESSVSASSSVMTRIEALLGGLDQINRPVAEKRILSFLCKCQLKALNGESVEDVQI